MSAGKPRNTLRGVGDAEPPSSRPRNKFDTAEQNAVVLQAAWEGMSEEERQRIVEGKPAPPKPLAGVSATPEIPDPTPVDNPLHATLFEDAHPPAALTDHKTLEMKTVDVRDDETAERRAATQRRLKSPPKPEDSTEITRPRSSKSWLILAGVGVVVLALVLAFSGSANKAEGTPQATGTSERELSNAAPKPPTRATESPTVSPAEPATTAAPPSATPTSSSRKPSKASSPKASSYAAELEPCTSHQARRDRRSVWTPFLNDVSHELHSGSLGCGSSAPRARRCSVRRPGSPDAPGERARTRSLRALEAPTRLEEVPRR